MQYAHMWFQWYRIWSVFLFGCQKKLQKISSENNIQKNWRTFLDEFESHREKKTKQIIIFKPINENNVNMDTFNV